MTYSQFLPSKLSFSLSFKQNQKDILLLYKKLSFRKEDTQVLKIQIKNLFQNHHFCLSRNEELDKNAVCGIQEEKVS